MANLDKLVIKVAMLPLYDNWCKYPAKIFSERLVTETPVRFQTPHKTIWIVDRPRAAYYCVISNFIWH
jgi:hypothetical protein